MPMVFDARFLHLSLRLELSDEEENIGCLLTQASFQESIQPT